MLRSTHSKSVFPPSGILAREVFATVHFRTRSVAMHEHFCDATPFSFVNGLAQF